MLRQPLKAGESLNSRTSDFHDQVIKDYHSTIFNNLVKLEENGNIERCRIQNANKELGMVLDFKHSKNQVSQISIPQDENSAFSGMMFVARLDEKGNEKKAYDILRIKEGKVIDVFCADPKPTLQNSRIAEIYEQLGREQTPPNKPRSFVDGIRVSSSNSRGA
ncbi:hypothetical protein NOVO_00925 [Rickettsiales bacterium Ac37b]|nr:hypothetical protein NOVO_00925 [Rickettsiales bacterium Ac37b]